jgi:hypothetical protein
MHQGRVLAEGVPGDIAANEAVQTAYLGESAKAARNGESRSVRRTHYATRIKHKQKQGEDPADGPQQRFTLAVQL